MPIILVRHAESEANQILHNNVVITEDHIAQIRAIDDPKLTATGLKQAEQIAQYLRHCLADKKLHVWISPFTRAQQTAQPFITSYKCESVTTHCDLYEHTSPGKPLSEEMLKLGVTHDLSHQAFSDRIVRFKNDLINRYDSETTLVIFGHSLFFSVLLNHLVMSQAPTSIVFQLPNCSVTTIDYKAGSWLVYGVGSIGHLSPEVVTGTHVTIGTQFKAN